MRNPISPTVRQAWDQRNTRNGGSGRPVIVTLPPAIVRRIVADVEAMEAEAKKLAPTIRKWEPRPLIVDSRQAPKSWAQNISEGVALGVCLALYFGACQLLAGR